MNKWLPALVLGAVSCGGEEPPPVDVILARQLIRETIEAYHGAGDKGDVDGMTALFLPEISMLKGQEDYMRGLEACAAELKTRVKTFDGQKRNTLLSRPEIEVHGETAVATYVANVGALRAPILVVLRRTPKQKWLIWHLNERWPQAQ